MAMSVPRRRLVRPHVRKLASTVAFCWSVLSTVVPLDLALAEETFTTPFGGFGGAPFALRCPSGTVVVGLTGRAGAWIDQIGPVCSNGARPGVAGGQGGEKKTAMCPQESMIRRLAVSTLSSENRLVDEIGFSCVVISNRARETGYVGVKSPVSEKSQGGLFNWLRGLNASSPEGGESNCGPDDIIGIQGRAGTSVDALGLICGDRITPAGPVQMANPALRPARSAQVSIGDPATCKPGFVWREAVPGDKVCVPPATRAKNQRLNSTARFRSSTGIIGGNCINGFVWREATTSDQACVSPEDRAEALYDNSMATQRRVGP